MAKSKTRGARKSAKTSKRGAKKAAQPRSARRAKNARKTTKSKSSSAGRRRTAKARPAAKKTAGAARGRAAKRRSSASAPEASAGPAPRAVQVRNAGYARPLGPEPPPKPQDRPASGSRKTVPRRPRTKAPTTSTARRDTQFGPPAPHRHRDRGFPSPPSSLNLDRSASAARSGRAELAQKLQAAHLDRSGDDRW